MITLLALANMIREDQVMLLDADIDVFDFVFDAINETWSDKTDRTKGYGFSLAELIDGLASLAQTEQNKKLIMEKEPLRLICTIMKESVVDMEKLSAIKFIWELAFLEENKEKIVVCNNILNSQFSFINLVWDFNVIHWMTFSMQPVLDKKYGHVSFLRTHTRVRIFL